MMERHRPRSVLVVLLLSASGLLLVTTWALARRPQEISKGGVPAFEPLAGRAQASLVAESVRTLAPPGVRPGRPSAFRGAEPRGPTRIRIPALHVDARIVPVGVEASGEMQVPRDITTVGWYRFGVLPGEPGTSVLVGHVDSRLQGLGVFFHLRDLEPGMRILVTGPGGVAETFAVTGLRSYAKDALPSHIFVRHGPAILALITCGGVFDPAAGHYSDNVVVYAELDPATRDAPEPGSG